MAEKDRREEDEGLMMLAGLSIADMANVIRWDDDPSNEIRSERNNSSSSGNQLSKCDCCHRAVLLRNENTTAEVCKDVEALEARFLEQVAFCRAYRLSDIGKVESPAVKVMDFSPTGKGYGLVTTRHIPRG